MLKRLFIEGEEELDISNMETMAINIAHMAGLPLDTKYTEFFHAITTGAATNPVEVWELVKKADETYMSSALIPRYGGSGHGAFGAPSLFNGMMWRSIEEGIVGKKVFIYRPYSAIDWSVLKPSFLDKAFRKNYLYVHDIDITRWEQVDIDLLLKDEFSYTSNKK